MDIVLRMTLWMRKFHKESIPQHETSKADLIINNIFKQKRTNLLHTHTKQIQIQKTNQNYHEPNQENQLV